MLGVTLAVPLLQRIAQVVESLGHLHGDGIPTEEITSKVTKLQETLEKQAKDGETQEGSKQVEEEVADGVSDVLDMVYKLLENIQRGEVGEKMDSSQSGTSKDDVDEIASLQGEADDEQSMPESLEWDGDEALVEGKLLRCSSSFKRCIVQ